MRAIRATDLLIVLAVVVFLFRRRRKPPVHPLPAGDSDLIRRRLLNGARQLKEAMRQE